MGTAKKIVEKASSGDAGFDNAIQQFFPKNKSSINQDKLKEVEERFGVPFNNGKTKVKIAFGDEKAFIERLSELLKSEQREFEF